MTPETKKTLIYGGVISFAVGAGLYIWSRYQGGTGDGGASAQAAAQAQAQADATAANQETQLAQLAALSGGGGSLPGVTLSNEAPPDNFTQEIKQILEAAGLTAPTPTGAPTAPPASSPTSGLPQPTPPPVPVDGNPAVRAIPVSAQPGGARTFDHILADMPNYPTTIQ